MSQASPLPPAAPAGPPASSPNAADPRASFGRRRWLLGAAVVAAVTVAQMVPPLLVGHLRPHVVLRLASWALQVPLLMFMLSWHYVWAGRHRIGATRTLVTSLVISILSGAVCSVLVTFVSRAMGLKVEVEHQLTYPAIAALGGGMGLFQCGIWALGFVYPFAAEDARLRAVEAEKLRFEAAELRSAAELARLRSQFEPHFLLNTLNAIAGLVTQDPREARRLIGCLGDLLRDALRDPEEMQTLDNEIAWLRRYAAILESRHSGALEFLWDVTGDAGSALLPRLLLQPLVENAVKHGALRRSGGGQVTVRAHVEPSPDGSEPRVVCTVEDNGPGMGDGAPRSGAFGLRAVRRRLELRYPDASLRIESSASGTRTVVELPRIVARSAFAGGEAVRA